MLDFADIISDTVADAVKLLPFLFLTYVAMEYMEHRMGGKARGRMERAGHFGPVFGAVFGVFPQCGFSAAASGLYAGNVITLGTLLAIYLSTSDEMLPILISEHAGLDMIFKLLGTKVLIGMAAGFAVDFFARRKMGKNMGKAEAGTVCVQDGGTGEGVVCPHGGAAEEGVSHGHSHCCCGEGILKSAAGHTVQVFLFLLLVSFLLNTVIGMAGEEVLADMVLNRPLAGHLIAGMVGLVPNCASSVVITQLYLEGLMGFGVMMAGLLVGSGVGLLVLFRVNGNRKENLKILFLLYAIGVASGMLLDMI